MITIFFRESAEYFSWVTKLSVTSEIEYKSDVIYAGGYKHHPSVLEVA